MDIALTLFQVNFEFHLLDEGKESAFYYYKPVTTSTTTTTTTTTTTKSPKKLSGINGSQVALVKTNFGDNVKFNLKTARSQCFEKVKF